MSAKFHVDERFSATSDHNEIRVGVYCEPTYMLFLFDPRSNTKPIINDMKRQLARQLINDLLETETWYDEES